MSTLAPCKRYITGHDASGKSIIHSSPPLVSWKEISGLSRTYSVASVPADITHDTDVAAYLSTDPKANPTSHLQNNIVNPNGTGVNLLVFELPPGGESQMHRTVSVDYVICVVGKIDMELDNGERISLNPGDHVIQRGTMHKWYNASKTEWARAVATTIPCVPFEVDGKMIQEEHLNEADKKKPDGTRL